MSSTGWRLKEGHQAGKAAPVYIQYVGFIVGGGSRFYDFDVIDAAEKAREFTIKVRSEAFRSSPLRFQDGPDICFKRLEQELEGETRESRAQSHLEVGEKEIQEYVARNYPSKPSTRESQEKARLVNNSAYRR
jgi:hypothetical protein